MYSCCFIIRTLNSASLDHETAIRTGKFRLLDFNKFKNVFSAKMGRIKS